jgi:hypothetical protein
MTKKELIESLADYNDDDIVVVASDNPDVHYEVIDVNYGWDEDYEKDVIILYS